MFGCGFTKTNIYICSIEHSFIDYYLYSAYLPPTRKIGNNKMPEKNHHCTEETDVTATHNCCGGNIFEEKQPMWKRKPIGIIVVSAAIFAVALYLNKFLNHAGIAELIFLVVVAVTGFDIVKGALKGLLKLRFNMNLLITIAAAGAFFIGHGEEGAAVMFLFYVAEFLEDYASERARSSIASLLKMAPDIAHVLRNSQELEVHVHNVNLNEIVVVRPGDKIPLDGIVLKGSSAVNQSQITGESAPVTKKQDDQVFAGTINIEGYLEVRVTRKSNDTILSKIIDLVRKSKEKKSKAEAFIDRFANYYTTSMILMAVIIATVPPFLFGMSLNDWFYRALVLLVVSCPCALAISTPVSMVSGITSATRNGVLIKGGEYVEQMKNVNAIVFDKTGTLTQGRLEVTDIMSFNGYSRTDVLRISASLESHSKHPLAKAIRKKAKNENIELESVQNFKSMLGTGLRGEINNQIFYVGGESLFNGFNIPWKKIRKYDEKGKNTVLLGNNKEIIGLIVLRDQIKDGAEDVVKFLKKENLITVMLTGDKKGTANAVSSYLGLDECYHGLLPEDKVKKIDELITIHGNVAMVGDGVNDAPALAKANIGIAMGAAGSDVAIETADIALMNDDLSKLEYLIKLSKSTMNVVKENVILSVVVKSSFALFAVLGFVTLWMAVGIGDMGLSLAVILNSLRIGLKK